MKEIDRRMRKDAQSGSWTPEGGFYGRNGCTGDIFRLHLTVVLFHYRAY
jgi:hypothetical protein